MANRSSPGICLTHALAFAVVLLNISSGTCLTATWSNVSGILTNDEAEEVYQALEKLVNNGDNYILPDRNYHAGRIFFRDVNVNVNRTSVVIRLTRWSSQCSVSMTTDYTKGSELLEAFRHLLPALRPYLVTAKYNWAAVSNLRYWIDYYVDHTGLLTESSYKVFSDGEGNGVDDCTIQPHMLLSHNKAHAFNQMYPGDSLLSPNAKYKLTIPKSGRVMAPCVLNLEDQDGNIKWQSDSQAPWPQNNCFLMFTSDGKLELRNKNNIIWQNVRACSLPNQCAGAASLAVEDSGDVNLYRSVGNYLGIYWSAVSGN
ncbi:hypothetical protein SUGI_1083930 [Cryptomeria japonica]|nr:hypothetical protein SUGI_1083930 [Cryptomeria japonica]